MQKALPLLNDGASIILNSSVVNEIGAHSARVYAGTKAALRSFARTLTTELIDGGIRIDVVSPGPIVTPIFGRTGLPQEATDEFTRNIITRVPMKRLGQPEEVAKYGAVACDTGVVLHHRSRHQRGWWDGTGVREQGRWSFSWVVGRYPDPDRFAVVCRLRVGEAFEKRGGRGNYSYPPICTIVREAGTKSGSPMWWRASFRRITPRMKFSSS